MGVRNLSLAIPVVCNVHLGCAVGQRAGGEDGVADCAADVIMISGGWQLMGRWRTESVRSICIVRLTPATAEMISDGTRPEGARDSDAPHRASSARGEPATVALKALEVRACGIHE